MVSGVCVDPIQSETPDSLKHENRAQINNETTLDCASVNIPTFAGQVQGPIAPVRSKAGKVQAWLSRKGNIM